MASAPNQSDLEMQLRKESAFYERMRVKVEDLLGDLLAGARVETSMIESRVKDPRSFAEKVKRKGYEDPFADTTDLVGIRIILYYDDDRERVGDLIRREFEIDDVRSSFGTASRQDPDRFQYDHDHYVVWTKDSRLEMTEWSPYRGRAFEIQVRTVLQHAWAAISHKLAYKREDDIPRELQRQLFRLSALLELADEQFADLRDRTSRLESEHKAAVASGQELDDVSIDAVSLEAYFQVTGEHLAWAERARAAGFAESPELLSGEEAENTLSILNRMLRHADLRTLADLRQFLATADEWGADALREFVLRAEAHPSPRTPEAYPYDVITFLVAIGAPVPADEVLRSGFWPALTQSLLDVRDARLT